jgi:integrase
VSIEDYTLKNARHSVSVRARKRGASLEWIAQQLGHKSIYQAANVYARFEKDADERLREVAK